MTDKAATDTGPTFEAQALADWQQAYVETTAALGASWCDFVGERFHAYAHAIDEVSHCQDFSEAFKLQSTFGEQTLKAYSDQAARLSGLMMEAAKGNGKKSKH
jgi:hypothetical protein